MINLCLFMLSWSVAAQLPAGSPGERLGLAGPFGGVNHDVVLIAGGSNFPLGMPWKGGKKAYYSDICVLQKDYRWVATGRFRLPEPIAYGASVTTPHGVVCIGGENLEGVSKLVYLLNWDSASQKVVIGRMPDLPLGLSNAAAAYANGKVYVAGGETASGVSAGFYCLDMDSPVSGWVRLADLTKEVSHTLLIDAGNELFLIGGRRKNVGGVSDLYASVDVYDLRTGRWMERRSLPYALSAGTGVRTAGGKIWLFGGDGGATFTRTERLIAAIAVEKDDAKKKMLVEEKQQVQSAHPGFSREILQYDIATDAWTAIGRMPFPTPVTTTAFAWDDRFVIPGGEIKSGVRTSKIWLVKQTGHE